MKDIKITITDNGLFSKWVGAELVNAIDSRNMGAVAYLLRNRVSLTTSVFIGKPEDPNVEIYVEALQEEGREPIIIFETSKKLFPVDKPRTEQEDLNRLATLLLHHSFEICREDDEPLELMPLPEIDKNAN